MSAISSEAAPPVRFTPDEIVKAIQAPRVKLDVWSHGVRISGFGNDVRTMMLDMCRQVWGEYSMVRAGRFRMEKKISRVYAGSNKQRSYFHFHRNSLPKVMAGLTRLGIPEHRIQITEHPMYEPDKAVHPLKDDRPPREKQLPIIEYLAAPLDPRYAPSKVVTLPTGFGKAQPLDAEIKVPGGWKTMGDMVVGTKVIAKDGTITHVTGVYPQGEKEIYRITFGDGRSTECCAEHLWKVFFIDTTPAKRWRVVNTLEVMRLLGHAQPRVYIDLPDVEDGTDAELPIDPYLLGALLGDGHLGKNAIYFSSQDEFILEQVRQLLPENLTLRHMQKYDYRIAGARATPNDLLDKIRSLELSGCHSYSKFIPDMYLAGSAAQRRAMLQGLLDTDGTVVKVGGSVSFCTTSPFLASQVQYLVRSLGGIAKIKNRHTNYTYKGASLKGRESYHVFIRHKVPSQFFRLPRKVALCRDDGQYSAKLKLRVKSVELVGVKEAQCISIDHPDRLYITNDFIVTHNTFIGLKDIRSHGVRAAIVLKGMYIDKWIGDIEEAYGAEKGALMVIRGIPQLRAAIEMARLGNFKPRIVVFSNKTLFMLMKYYEQNGVDEFIPVSPMDLYKHLGIGYRLIDEVHQEFHCNFRQDIYTHIPLTVSLSATLEPDSPFIREMYETVWPPGTWAPEVEHSKHVAVKSIWYRLIDPGKLRWLNFMRQYSHTEYEKSILKNPQILRNYLDMIADLVEKLFTCKREPGQKMMIFVATVQMATIVQEMLAGIHRGMIVNRYVSEDEYEDLVGADISVTTLQSAGTAVDVPNLRVTLMTTALSTKQGNIQVLGRTRPLIGWPDVTPEFCFLSAKDCDKHVGYAKEKREKLSGKVKSFQDLESDYRV